MKRTAFAVQLLRIKLSRSLRLAVHLQERVSLFLHFVQIFVRTVWIENNFARLSVGFAEDGGFAFRAVESFIFFSAPEKHG